MSHIKDYWRGCSMYFHVPWACSTHISINELRWEFKVRGKKLLGNYVGRLNKCNFKKRIQVCMGWNNKIKVGCKQLRRCILKMCGFWFRLYVLLHSGIKMELKREEIVFLQVLEQMPTQAIVLSCCWIFLQLWEGCLPNSLCLLKIQIVRLQSRLWFKQKLFI